MLINYSNQEVVTGEKSIFLAGPTPRNDDVESWRKEACELLRKNGFDGVVYIPEYSTWENRIDYIDQVHWERKALSNASVILFWIPRSLPEFPGFTTNVEFGYWIHSGKVLYGRPDDSVRNKYLDWLYKEDTKEEPFNDLEELIKESINKANEIGVNTKTEILPLEDRLIMKEEL